MAKKPGDTFGFQFVTKASTGALSNADGLPTGTIVRNGVDDATPVVVVTNVSPGIYKATGTIPIGYASGDGLQVRINATVAAVASAGLHDYGAIDGNRVSEVYLALAADVIPFVVSDGAPTVTSFVVAVAAGVVPADLVGMICKFTGLNGAWLPAIAALAVTATTVRLTVASPGFAVVPANGAAGILI